ncbi:MAG TPA: hypothetical protein VF711_09590, partial [Acidimicrobiales bacterium]
VDDKVNREAFDAALSHVLGSLLSFTGWLIFSAVAVAAIAFLSGPSARAEHMRQGTRRLLRDAASGLAKAGSDYDDHPILQWVRHNSVFLQVGAVAVVVLVMLLFDFSWPTLVLLFVFLAVFEFIVYFLSAGQRARSLPSPSPEPAGELEPAAMGELGPSESERGSAPDGPGAGEGAG